MFLEVGSAFIVFFILVGFSFIPYCLLKRNVSRSPSKSSTSNYVLSLCNCFACGIFLSTCFLGLLPHVQHHEEVIRKNYRGAETNGTAPELVGWKSILIDSNLVVLCGFLLILLIEQLIFCCSSDGESSKDSASYHQPRSTKDSTHKFFSLDGDVGEPLVDTSFGDESDDEGKIEFRMTEGVEDHFHEHEHGHHHHHHHVLPAGGLSIRSFFLLIGLSIHSIFEGVALGVQGEINDFVSVLVAIMVHEVLCSLAYGVSLAQQHATPRSALISIALLSACIPLGMCSAFMIQTLDSATALGFRFALEGLAAGTFVYVSCVEMLSAEIGGHDRKGIVKAFLMTKTNPHWIIYEDAAENLIVLDEFRYYQSVYGKLFNRKDLYEICSPFLMDSQLNKTSNRVRRKKIVNTNIPRLFLERCNRVQKAATHVREVLGVKCTEESSHDQSGNKALKEAIEKIERTTNALFSDRDFPSLGAKPLSEGDLIEQPSDEATVYENSEESVKSVLSPEGDIIYCPPGSSFLMGHVNLSRHLTISAQCFDFILMDPPWQNRSVKRKSTYSMFENKDLSELRIPDLLNEEGLIAMWVTNSHRAQAAAEAIISEWKLQWIATWHWLKITKSFAPVYQFTPHHKVPFESLFLACRPESIGKYDFIRDDFCFASVPHGCHSRKPPVHAVLHHLGLPLTGRNLELYARCLQPHFTSVGYEPLRFQNKIFFSS
ncbi:hypothetical protein QR680_001344 [Steinernema hermaphroditum]|uniref:Uncharacterized protein n=1 Tax=Steinernema hermaphroditum TaxID=289476 RepID=A0AA39GXW3_9BILA|nr:hypothetical protein QR680_001344 [Steinernema hermaphroditum]